MIENHADRELPNECVGLVLRFEDRFAYLPLKNISNDPQREFKVDPISIAKHYDQIAYIVHSHVNLTARPSEGDIRACDRIQKPFFIISVPSNSFYTQYPKNYRFVDFIERDFFYGGNDCFTLIRDFYQREFGIELYDPIRPSYGWWLSEDRGLCEVTIQEAMRNGFRKVSEPKHGDVVILRAGANPSHWAVYLNDGEILQNTLNHGGRRETYNAVLRRSTVCFLRHHERN